MVGVGAGARIGDVTLNLEGLWLVQALLDISVLAPELRGVPYAPAPSKAWLVDHPGVAVLREQGLVIEHRQVAPAFAARMHVLTAPDVEVVIMVSPGPLQWLVPDAEVARPETLMAVPAGQLRAVLARRDGRWVSAVRAGDEVTIDDAGWCSGPPEFAGVVGQLLDVLHPCPPAKMSAVNLAAEQLLAAASAGADCGRMELLGRAGLRGAALAQVAAVLEDPVAEAVLYARAYADTAVHNSAGALDVRDSQDGGRAAVYRLAPVPGSAQDWMTVTAATAAQLEQGIATVLDSVPVRHFDTHTRA